MVKSWATWDTPCFHCRERESNGSSTHWLLFPVCQLVKMIGQYKSFMWSQSVLFTLTWFFFSTGLFYCSEWLKLFWILKILKHWVRGEFHRGVIFLWQCRTHWVLPSEWGVLIYLCIAQECVLSQDLWSLFNLQNERLITLCWQHLQNIDGAYCFSYNSYYSIFWSDWRIEIY